MLYTIHNPFHGMLTDIYQSLHEQNFVYVAKVKDFKYFVLITYFSCILFSFPPWMYNTFAKGVVII